MSQSTPFDSEQVLALAVPIAAEQGLDAISAQLKGSGSNACLEIVLDLPEDELGSPDLDHVAEAAREISLALDEANVMGEQPYLLEVGTPGAERKLETIRDFKRARTRLAQFKLESGAEFVARIIEVDGDELELERKAAKPGQKPESLRVRLAEVAKARMQVEFK